MRDSRSKAALKRCVRALLTLETRLRRARRPPRYELGGTCRLCARCCEEPSIRVGTLVWRFPLAQRLFLAWQRRVNGFELLRCERDSRSFVFRCTHFDPETRRCDSYESRPWMCRDYPRFLLQQPWPELFSECGYRPLARNRSGLSAALEDTDLSEEKKAELRRKLFLE